MGVEDDINIGRSRYIKVPGVYSRFPEEDIPYKMILTFTDFKYTPSAELIDVISIQKLQGETILLPLPLQLNDNTSIKAGPTSAAGPAYDLISGAAQAGLGGLALKMGEKFLSSKSLIGKIAAAAATFASGFAAANLDKIVSTAGVITGTAVNPFDTMMFEGVNLKKHSFSWKLSPSTKSESDSIRNIVNLLKQKSLPAYRNLKFGFNYPSIANIAFIGIDQEYYYKLKPAMITDISIKYNNSDQLNVYRGGKPVIVELNIELTEVTVHTSEDYGGSSGEDVTDTGSEGKVNANWFDFLWFFKD